MIHKNKMSKNIKLLLSCFILSMCFWWGINVFEKNIGDFFYAMQLKKHPPLYANISSFSLLEEHLNKYKETNELDISAKSAISIFVGPQERNNIIFKKHENEKLPIASLTKLMTALVVSNIYQEFDTVKISKQAIEQEGNEIELKVGEVFPINELLYIMLIESSNDAAYALATPDFKTEKMLEKDFVDLMNLYAYYDVGLNPETTHFVNSTGLDPEEPSEDTNYSTVKDLVKLVEYILENKPEIFEILSQKENQSFRYTLKNTNELLGEVNGITGGKTGYTDKAGGCLILILEGPSKDSYFINIILGSNNRFGEMEQLINWSKQALKF
jgi:D-alanyl-D-alanine carboxypeptidase